MNPTDDIQIISFYEFKDLKAVGELEQIKADFKEVFIELGVRGTIILASEGYNGMVCAETSTISKFICRAEEILKTDLIYKSSGHATSPFRKIDIKIKPEIVTLKQEVDISLGQGTHIDPSDWNKVISDPETFLLDARNDYEYESGTFFGAVNPQIKRFSDLPAYVDANLDPAKHKRIAMFCTGGIRCEKFAPYLKQIGFEEVFQLDGGILKYLEQVPVEETKWEGECFVFDERITVDASLNKGSGPDRSQRISNRKNPAYKIAE